MQTSYFSQGRSDEKKALFPTSTTSLHLPVIRSVYTLRLCENGGLVRQSVHQFICVSIYRSVGLSVGPSVHWSVSPWSRDAFSDSPNHLYKVVCPLVRPSVCRLLVQLSVGWSICQSIPPLVHWSVRWSFCRSMMHFVLHRKNGGKWSKLTFYFSAGFLFQPFALPFKIFLSWSFFHYLSFFLNLHLTFFLSQSLFQNHSFTIILLQSFSLNLSFTVFLSKSFFNNLFDTFFHTLSIAIFLPSPILFSQSFFHNLSFTIFYNLSFTISFFNLCKICDSSLYPRVLV